ncbi:MAG: hypothetical protein ABIP79_00810 [Chitinophagaceae bacterium]
MTLQSEKLSEKQIIKMFQENDPLAWESLYEKYAPAMYGLICNLTDDKSLAEQIFINAFIQAKKKETLSKVKNALYAILLRHTYFYAITYLKQVGINPKTLNPLKETKLIHLLTTQCNSIKEAASILTITVKETKKRLNAEFLELGMQN